MPDEEDHELTDEDAVPESPLHARTDEREEEIEEGDSSDEVGDTQSGGPGAVGSHDEEE